ncbi:MAG: hypothetical protein JF887_13075 [Candidatus Dormibacteraeota bacterium]|uniref:Uncharacterized protein n=1 Tax=Candidatus Amunia macphersoniae TaxID=3127014 RepID=A0A934KQE2_9BACT|nr:hypothetical protein [Candidatus Dormibacteraeota bacterium]
MQFEGKFVDVEVGREFTPIKRAREVRDLLLGLITEVSEGRCDLLANPGACTAVIRSWWFSTPMHTHDLFPGESIEPVAK